MWAYKRIEDVPWHVRRWIMQRARYLWRRLDRWTWGYAKLGSPYLRDGQCWMDVSVNRRDWRYKAMLVWLLLKSARLDMTVWRWTFPVWGWWHGR